MTHANIKRSWKFAPITRRQHDILLLLAAGYSDQQICSRYVLRPTQLDGEIDQLKTAYHAQNVRILITLAYLDDEISLPEVLPFVVSLLNSAKVQDLNG